MLNSDENALYLSLLFLFISLKIIYISIINYQLYLFI